jgi:2-iminobutanoate/2-iminopropanoate deaminase
MKIEHVNPTSLHGNPAFTQLVTVEGAHKLAYVGGQNATDADGIIIGRDLATQTEQAFRNVLAALEAVGARQEHVVKLSVYLVQGHDVGQAFGAAQRVWGSHPTAISVVTVVGLASPEFLVEIEAVAAIGA